MENHLNSHIRLNQNLVLSICSFAVLLVLPLIKSELIIPPPPNELLRLVIKTGEGKTLVNKDVGNFSLIRIQRDPYYQYFKQRASITTKKPFLGSMDVDDHHSTTESLPHMTCIESDQKVCGMLELYSCERNSSQFNSITATSSSSCNAEQFARLDRPICCAALQISPNFAHVLRSTNPLLVGGPTNDG